MLEKNNVINFLQKQLANNIINHQDSLFQKMSLMFTMIILQILNKYSRIFVIAMLIN